MTEVVLGSLVSWNSKLGVVETIEVDGDGAQATIGFDDGERMIFKLDAGAIERVSSKPGCRSRGSTATWASFLSPPAPGIIRSGRSPSPADTTTVVEMALRPASARRPDRAHACRPARPRCGQFNMRAVAAEYWLAHRHSPLVSAVAGPRELDATSGLRRASSGFRVPPSLHALRRGRAGKDDRGGDGHQGAACPRSGSASPDPRPLGLQRQWQFELKTKFNEAFAIYNSRRSRISRTRARETPGPSTTRSSPRTPGLRGASSGGTEIASVPWDMVIVDEAHHARAQRHGASTSVHQPLPPRPRPGRSAGGVSARGSVPDRLTDAARLVRAVLDVRDARPGAVRVRGRLCRAPRQSRANLSRVVGRASSPKACPRRAPMSTRSSSRWSPNTSSSAPMRPPSS